MKKESDGLIRGGRLNKSDYFETELRDELIKKIEAGMPRSVIAYHYGVSRAAISQWMRKHSWTPDFIRTQISERNKLNIKYKIYEIILLQRGRRLSQLIFLAWCVICRICLCAWKKVEIISIKMISTSCFSVPRGTRP